MTDSADSAAAERLRNAYVKDHIGFAMFAERLSAVDADPCADVSDLPEAGPARPGTQVIRPLDRLVLATLARIDDPVQRCVHAGAVARLAETEIETARLARNAALVALHIQFAIPQAQCYRPYGIGRRLFRAAVANSAATVSTFKSADAARDEAGRYHAVYERERSRADTGRMVRDGEIRALTRGDYGVEVPATELAKELRTSRARVSQVRSTRPRVRNAPPRPARRVAVIPHQAA